MGNDGGISKALIVLIETFRDHCFQKDFQDHAYPAERKEN